MARALGLSFHLERIVTRIPYAVIAVDRLERKCVRERGKAATQSVAGNYAACGGRADIFIHLANQDVRAARASVPHGKNHIAGSLMLDVEVVLLDHALNEIAVHRLNGSRVSAGVHRCAVNSTSGDRRSRGRARREKKPIRQTATGAAKGGTNASGKGIHFRVERRILPQSLSALIPRGIVEDGISGAYRGLWAHWRPSQTDTWFESRFLKLNANAVIRSDAVGATAQPGAAGGDVPLQGINIEIRLTIFYFGFGRSQSPCNSDVYSQISRYPPIILDEGTEQFPAAADCTSQECLIVSRECPQASEKQICHVVASRRGVLRDKAILECIVSYIHLLGADDPAETNIVFAANQVERIRDRIDVGAPLVRSVSAISQRHVASHLKRGHSATDAVFIGLVQTRRITGYAIAVAA